MASWVLIWISISVESKEDGKSLLWKIESKFKKEMETPVGKVTTLEMKKGEKNMRYWYEIKWIVKKDDKWRLVLYFALSWIDDINYDFLIELYKFCWKRKIICWYNKNNYRWEIVISEDILTQTLKIK